jgi:hypothetical protein
MMAMLQSPDMMDVLTRHAAGESVDQKELITALGRDPETAGLIMKALASSGQISFGQSNSRPSNPSGRVHNHVSAPKNRKKRR